MLACWADNLSTQLVQGGPCGKEGHIHVFQGFGLGAFKNKGCVQISVLRLSGVGVMVGMFWFCGLLRGAGIKQFCGQGF